VTAQANRASGLNLIVSAIILWNAVYLERAITAAKRRGDPVPKHLVRHIAPLGWEHINLSGDFFWRFETPKTPDGYPRSETPITISSPHKQNWPEIPKLSPKWPSSPYVRL